MDLFHRTRSPAFGLIFAVLVLFMISPISSLAEEPVERETSKLMSLSLASAGVFSSSGILAYMDEHGTGLLIVYTAQTDPLKVTEAHAYLESGVHSAVFALERDSGMSFQNSNLTNEDYWDNFHRNLTQLVGTGSADLESTRPPWPAVIMATFGMWEMQHPSALSADVPSMCTRNAIYEMDYRELIERFRSTRL